MPLKKRLKMPIKTEKLALKGFNFTDEGDLILVAKSSGNGKIEFTLARTNVLKVLRGWCQFRLRELRAARGKK